MELIEAHSNGAFSVKVYHSASLGNETEILQQVQMNTIEMAIVTGGPFDTFEPITRSSTIRFFSKTTPRPMKSSMVPLERKF